MNKLIRNYPRLEEELFRAYNILSNAGFEIQVEHEQISVWHSLGAIELDIEEGIVIVDDDYREEFEKRQNELLNINY
jgi:hypothetical protein